MSAGWKLRTVPKFHLPTTNQVSLNQWPDHIQCKSQWDVTPVIGFPHENFLVIGQKEQFVIKSTNQKGKK